MLYFVRNTDWLRQVIAPTSAGARRTVFFSLVAVTTAYGMVTMFDILRANGTTLIEGLILVLFSVTFGWIALSFWTAAAGFVLQLLGRDPLSLKRNFPRGDPDAPVTTRTALIMPVYNEDTRRVIAGLEATALDLLDTGEGAQFDLYLLSDSNRTDVAAAEQSAIGALARRLDGIGVFYRRRTDNRGRKAGNIAEFCRRWGAGYDYMVVLDADSVMSGGTLVRLVRAMQANPVAGMIQTVPIPVRQQSMFARSIQFAASLYSPMQATGSAFWQKDTANYWGHNAIIRVKAFMDYCGLPTLPGDPPLGGEILSHDFVEAALMRRGGYHVYLVPEMEGSFEEVPANLLDYAKRDRRWAEGNLQHLRLLFAHGLHPLNRLHFLLGALAYVCSFLWLLMLAVSTVDAVGRALSPNEYFGTPYQLFPNWPVARTEQMMLLLAIVISMLFLPKVMGVLACLIDRDRRIAFGGTPRLLASALIELLFAVLIAPVMMTYHAWFVTNIVLGRRVTWNPQCREGQCLGTGESMRSTLVATLAGIAWGVGTAYVTPIYFWALTPVLVGLVLSAPLVYCSSSVFLGRWMRARGLFLTPSEVRPAPALTTLHGLLAQPGSGTAAGQPVELPELPPERPGEMRAQSIDRGPRWDRPVSYSPGT